MWVRMAHITGFPNWQTALQFEWRWKQITRQLNKLTLYKNMPALQKRMEALKQLLALDKCTTKAIPYKDWSESPGVVLEDDLVRKYYT